MLNMVQMTLSFSILFWPLQIRILHHTFTSYLIYFPDLRTILKPSYRGFYNPACTYLPNSVETFIDHQELIENRKQKQVDISRKKGRSCTNHYEIGDRVLVQDHVSKHWNIRRNYDWFYASWTTWTLVPPMEACPPPHQENPESQPPSRSWSRPYPKTFSGLCAIFFSYT